MGIVLMGYRGSGKTTVGKLLARRMRKTFIDTDAEIVRQARTTIREIFANDGEDAFRDLEAIELHNALRHHNAIIALGGGAVIRQENRNALKKASHRKIYLCCDAETLYARIHADPASTATRPALTRLNGALDEVRQLLAIREPMYREVMTEEIDVSKLTAEDVVERLMHSEHSESSK